MSRSLLAVRRRIAEAPGTTWLGTAATTRSRPLASSACLKSLTLYLAPTATRTSTTTIARRYLHGDRSDKLREKPSVFRDGPRGDEREMRGHYDRGRSGGERRTRERFTGNRDSSGARGNGGSSDRMERFKYERRTGERPSAQRYSSAQTSADRYSSERPSADRYSSDRRTLELPSRERYTSKRSTAERPSEERYSSDRHLSERSSDRPSGDLYSSERRPTDHSTGQLYSTERRTTASPSEKRSFSDRHASEHPSGQRSLSERLSWERRDPSDSRSTERHSPRQHTSERDSTAGRTSEMRLEPHSGRGEQIDESQTHKARPSRSSRRSGGELLDEEPPKPKKIDWAMRPSDYPKDNSDYDKKYALEQFPKMVETETFEKFRNLQLDGDLVMRIIRAFPYIREPTPVQSAFFMAMERPSDILMAAHTSTGKSLAVLIGLLRKHKNLLCHMRESVASGKAGKEPQSVASILVVPSRELALQYFDWIERIVPESLHPGLPDLAAVVVKGPKFSGSSELDRLEKRTPRILIATPEALQEMLMSGRSVSILNLLKLDVLALDEADLLFKLPYRFPARKAIWKHMKHLPPTLSIMNSILKLRCTFSSGESMPFAGLEIDKPAVGNVVPALSKRTAHLGRREMLKFRRSRQTRDRGEEEAYQRETELIVAPERTPMRKPLQLIVFSATVNEVMRHFLGARTGWLRTGLRDENRAETGKWIDFTGFSPGVKKADELKGKSHMPEEGERYPTRMPRGIEHYCVVVDAPAARWADPAGPTEAEASDETLIDQSWRNYDRRLSSSTYRALASSEHRGKELLDLKLVEPRTQIKIAKEDEHHYDLPILTCVAYIFASQAVRRAMLVVPTGVSKATVIRRLKTLGVPARELLGQREITPRLSEHALATSQKSNGANETAEAGKAADVTAADGTQSRVTAGAADPSAEVGTGGSTSSNVAKTDSEAVAEQEENDDAVSPLQDSEVTRTSDESNPETRSAEARREEVTASNVYMGEAGEVMYVIDSHMVRGIDVPGGISHVFVHGLGTVSDAATYAHIAGRVSRLGLHSLVGDSGAHQRPPGKVITLLRGVGVKESKLNLHFLKREAVRREYADKETSKGDEERQGEQKAAMNDVLMGTITGGIFNAPPSSVDEPQTLPQRIYSSEEVKMALIYQHLSVRPRKLQPLGSGVGTDQWTAQDELSEEEVRRDEEEREQESEAMAAIMEQFNLDINDDVWQHPQGQVLVPRKKRTDKRVLK